MVKRRTIKNAVVPSLLAFISILLLLLYVTASKPTESIKYQCADGSFVTELNSCSATEPKTITENVYTGSSTRDTLTDSEKEIDWNIVNLAKTFSGIGKYSKESPLEVVLVKVGTVEFDNAKKVYVHWKITNKGTSEYSAFPDSSTHLIYSHSLYDSSADARLTRFEPSNLRPGIIGEGITGIDNVPLSANTVTIIYADIYLGDFEFTVNLK
jgi:hypothetical protein